MKIFLEDVFKTSGTPTYTFVKPIEYTKLLVSLRTKGRGLVIEGPSGIGKTTSINKAIDEIGLNAAVTSLSARKKEDVDLIQILPEFNNFGIAIIDDFHVLPNDIKQSLSDYMKTLADEDSISSKLILIGINKAGDSLVSFSPDLNNRIDTIRFEANPEEKIEEMLTLGEQALNVKLNIKSEIVNESKGSFHIAQLLAKETCISCEIIDNESDKPQTDTSLETIKAKVNHELGRLFYPKARAFAIGSKLRKEGRAPYLHLLNWLANSPDWSIQIDELLNQHPNMKLSINQVVEKGFLKKLIEDNSLLQDVIHYDDQSNVLTIEDPKFLFFIRNILWNKFAEQIGFIGIEFTKPYDFALSFAGENRTLAENLFTKLLEREISVFYDKNEQHRILASNVEDYLAPIYNSEAEFVIVLLSKDYPKKIWTKFESDQFKQRFGDNAIIPIWFSDTDTSLFDETRKYGGLSFNVENDLGSEAENIVTIVSKKLEEKRKEKSSASKI
ncbi:TIR domain-containing protein [Mongoliitalea daihaiensis]|uniref:TIR domain-containing protein n=1 Tax=Mongoliitalea daihaiensis TaxID=2782006 RepID=UPI001F28BBB9|nr:TIR domain-containing protein [Mongoliitalea daihaiensis]UJP65121.1 TIR domain-containing protein [Mongoliitalea daihaiensis]